MEHFGFLADNIALEHVAFSPKQLLQKCKTEALSFIKEKDVALQINCNTDIYHTVFGDPARLHQLCMYLILNGIRHTNEGAVKAFLEITPEPDNNCNISLAFTDSGIGMTMTEVASIFAPFNNPHLTPKYSGECKCLTSTISLARAMGGDIKIESIKGLGTRIVFSCVFETPIDAYANNIYGVNIANN